MKMIMLSPYVRFTKTEQGNISIYHFLLNKYQSYYQKNDEIYRYCLQPRPLQEVIERFGKGVVAQLTKLHQLCDPADIWQKHRVTTLEIETSTVCNWRCEYCPVQYETRKPEFIDREFFRNILSQAVDYGHIKEVTLHSFNEPSLDKNFDYYLDEVSRTNFKVLVFTNGSCMNEEKLEHIRTFGSRAEVILNFPSLDREKYCRMTGANTYDQSIATLETAIAKGLKIIVNIQGRGEEREREANRFQERFPQALIVTYESFDRAGTLENEYGRGTALTAPYMAGCYMVTRSVYVSVHGDLFMCCNDFSKKYIAGNIKNSSIYDVLTNDKASAIRQKVWGGMKAEDGFICRSCSLMEDFIGGSSFFTIDQVIQAENIHKTE